MRRAATNSDMQITKFWKFRIKLASAMYRQGEAEKSHNCRIASKREQASYGIRVGQLMACFGGAVFDDLGCLLESSYSAVRGNEIGLADCGIVAINQ